MLRCHSSLSSTLVRNKHFTHKTLALNTTKNTSLKLSNKNKLMDNFDQTLVFPTNTERTYALLRATIAPLLKDLKSYLMH